MLSKPPRGQSDMPRSPGLAMRAAVLKIVVEFGS